MTLNRAVLIKFLPAILTLAIWATPFSVRVNNPFIYAFALYCLVIGWPYDKSVKWKDLTFLLPIILYLVYVAGIVWSIDRHEGWKQLEKRIALVVFPLIFFVIRHKFTKEDVRLILFAFLIVCLGISLLCYGSALLNVIENRSFKVVGELERNYYYFSYLPLTRAAVIEPIYISLYVNFSILILLFFPLRSRALTISLIIYLVFFNLLVASKAGIMGLGMMFFLYFLGIIKNKLLVAGLCIGLLIGFSVALKSSEFLRERFLVSTKFTYDLPWAGDWNSVSQRLAIWSCAVEAVEQRFSFGYGTGGGQVGLNAVYVQKKYIRGYEDQYNAHNEYLYTWLDTGIFGFAALAAMLIIPLVRAIKRRDNMFVIFLCLFSFYFMVEVVLTRRAGLNFFCFFYSLLALNSLICTREATVPS